MTKISIIIPIYNSVDYLRQCLDSVISQTFTDFECICVNDGSTDNSLSILQEYANKDKRFKVFSKENKGVSNARNTGVQLSVGEYITFIDSDDWVENNYLEELYNNFYSKDVDVCICNLKIYNAISNMFQTDSNIKILNKLYKKLLVQKFKNTKNIFKFISCARSVWGKLYRSSVIKNNNIVFFDNICGDEDYSFNIIFNMYAKNVVFIVDELYYYRKQISSLTSNDERLRINTFYSFVELIKELDKRNFKNNIIKHVCIDNLLYRIGKISKNVSEQNKNEMLKSIDKTLFYLLNNSKNIGFLYKIKLRFSLFIFRKYNLVGFKIFRVLKNIIY